MATIIEQEEINLNEGEELADISELVTASSEAEVAEIASKADELEEEIDIPEKFRGKSKKEIINSYKEAERELGRKANEIGELRRLADDIIKQNLQLNAGGTPAKKKIEVDDILENPEEALGYAVANNPEIKQLKEALIQRQRADELKQFESKHPDFRDVLVSDDFKEWISSSPVRAKQFAEADKNYDYQTADELFSLYKQINSINEQRREEAKEGNEAKRKAALKAASTEKGSTGQSSKKIYSRQALMKMIQTNREGYNDPAFQAELAKAYQEGRVR